MISKIQPVILAILDGWGQGKTHIGNAISGAKTPVFDSLTQNYPRILLQASGLGVGMNWGEAGNSEVGHIHLGAGRIIRQYRARIQRAIESKIFFKKKAFIDTFEYARQNKSSVHLIGLLTSGTVHADFGHISALIEFAKQYYDIQLYLHLFLDGKDSGLHEAQVGIEKLYGEISRLDSNVRLVSVVGRLYGMNRDNNWKLTKQAYDLITVAKGEKVNSFIDKIKYYYEIGNHDSDMPALVSNDYQGMGNYEGIIFFNFREDSMRQIFKAFTAPNFIEFPVRQSNKWKISSMTRYIDSQKQLVAFEHSRIVNSLAEVLSSYNKKQLHIAETQKYAHATLFFNGLRETPFPNEDDILLESPQNINENPELRAVDIASRVKQELSKNIYDFVVINIANADLIAHTGNYKNTVIAVQEADKALGILYESVVLNHNGILAITADHGNAEDLIYQKTGQPESRHNQSPINFVIVKSDLRVNKSSTKINRELKDVGGMLGDVAPTLLALMNIPQPREMTGQNLLPTLGINI